MDRVLLTRTGYETLMVKLTDMQGRGRREVADELEIARSHGDLRENADYDAAKEKQGMLEAQIRMLEDQLGRSEVIDLSSVKGDVVAFGAIVKIENLETEKISTYQIVGELESDLAKRKISVTAPIIKALLGKEVGDIVEIELAQGVQDYEILEIKTPSTKA